jgi:copper resistance protein B
MIRPVSHVVFAFATLATVVSGTASAQPSVAADPAEPAPRPYQAPELTDEDRKAAFPEVGGHPAHDNAVHALVLFDRFEWQSAPDASGARWDNQTWVGRDRDRLWLRSEGRAADGTLKDADVHVLYGRMIARWWDAVAGVRQDFEPGTARTWAAFGLQGLAPYWFDVKATGYIGEGWQTALRFDIDYDLRVTERVLLQPRIELNLYGQDDPERGLGAGLSSAEPGVRLRYEIRRELAPYLGVAWEQRFGGTADFAEAAGEPATGVRFVSGVRWWF